MELVDLLFLNSWALPKRKQPQFGAAIFTVFHAAKFRGDKNCSNLSIRQRFLSKGCIYPKNLF